MADIAKLIEANTKRWTVARVTGNGFAAVAARLSAPDARVQYEQLSARTNVPWYVIAVIHEREASQDWHANIAQGDPWNRSSVHDPAGRGPFTSWQDAGFDALVNCAPYASKWTDWSAGGTLTLLEKYNGLGYASLGVPSAYIWSGTDQYKSGKFTRDHHYDPNVVDSQLGCAGLLLAMGITFPAEVSMESLNTTLVVQQALNKLGYGPIAEDGLMGDQTKASLIAFQAASNLPQTGAADNTTLAAIDEALKAKS